MYHTILHFLMDKLMTEVSMMRFNAMLNNLYGKTNFENISVLALRGYLAVRLV